MIFASICSGIEAASVAWNPLRWHAAFFAETDKFASAVLNHHYPHIPNYGDVTKFKDWPDAAFDVLVGGTPCQSFSVAGLRKGLADPRGNLALVYLAIAARYRPRWLVWENVLGVLSSNRGRDFGAFLGGLGELGYWWAYRVLDAQYVRVDGLERAVPQRRRRVFVVGHLGDWRRAAAVLFERESLCGHSPPRREAGKEASYDIAPCIEASGRGFERAGDPRGQDCLVAFGGNNTEGPIEVATARNAHAVPHGRLDFESETFVAHSLRAVAFAQNSRDELVESEIMQSLKTGGGKPGQSYPAIRQGWAVRRLTPLECERLQGFPDGYTAIPYRGKPAADGPRYKALGNSMAVNCMIWLGQRIQMMENCETVNAGVSVDRPWDSKDGETSSEINTIETMQTKWRPPGAKERAMKYYAIEIRTDGKQYGVEFEAASYFEAERIRKKNGWTKDGEGFAPGARPLCPFCNAPWTDEMVRVFDIDASHGQGSYDFGPENQQATVDITCAACKRLIYRKKYRED